ncbi:MAG: hypothetical protein ACK559_40745, partial [bacterium]
LADQVLHDHRRLHLERDQLHHPHGLEQHQPGLRRLGLVHHELLVERGHLQQEHEHLLPVLPVGAAGAAPGGAGPPGPAQSASRSNETLSRSPTTVTCTSFRSLVRRSPMGMSTTASSSGQARFRRAS